MPVSRTASLMPCPVWREHATRVLWRPQVSSASLSAAAGPASSSGTAPAGSPRSRPISWLTASR
ncbi:MAG: hypothetical protein K0R41_4653 [Geminicoccaceae bacterium]|nr:hypothetical protein [Geminicoccaceae bacterium]